MIDDMLTPDARRDRFVLPCGHIVGSIEILEFLFHHPVNDTRSEPGSVH
jgi:hypothetical protein